MASLFKPTTISYWTPDGHKCQKSEACITNEAGKSVLRPGYRRKRQKAKKWYGRYRLPDRRLKCEPLAVDKSAAQAMLAKKLTDAERADAGITDPHQEQRRRPLAEHLEDFRKDLRAKGNTEPYVNLAYSRAKAVLDGCKFVRWNDISPSAVIGYLAERRKAGLGVQSSNYYLQAVKQFCRWMLRDRRVPENPLQHLSRQNAKVDVRLERRALPPEKFAAFVEAARQGADFRGLTGEDRAALYLLAANTGLRESELASLTPASFDFESDPAMVTVQAGYSKHRRRDLQPLRADVAEMMQRYIAGKPDDRPLWPGTWTERGAKMVRLDLAAAGIPFEDEAGHRFDFHAIRHQFISSLADAGVHPKHAQTLARHSTITLTMDRYTHSLRGAEAAALEKLPQLPTSRPAAEAGALRATGTDDEPVCARFAAAPAVPSGSLRCYADDSLASGAANYGNGPQATAGADTPRRISNPSVAGSSPAGGTSRQASTSDKSTPPLSSLESPDCTSVCDGLDRVISAWPRLPENVRAEILALLPKEARS